MTAIGYSVDDTTPCRCDDCGKITPIVELHAVSDIGERLDAGSIVPAGQCECGSLAYIVDERAPPWSAQARLARLESCVSTVYTLIWDHDNGIGCAIYTTKEKRDSAFREAVESFGVDASGDIDDDRVWQRIDAALAERDARFLISEQKLSTS
jgi:hypothetical protein